MGFKKGNQFGGRTPGAKNKTSSAIKDAYRLLIENNLEQMQKDLDSLEPKDRLSMLRDLTVYVEPKMRSVEAEISGNNVYPILNLGSGIDPCKIADMTDEQIDALND